MGLARGAAFLGAGGGDPCIGRLMLRSALDGGRMVESIDADDLPDDALVVPTASMGVLVSIESKSRPATRCGVSERV